MCCQGFDEALGTAFKKFIYQIIVFDSTLEKTCTLMSILEQKLRKIERETMLVHDKKRMAHLLCWELLIFFIVLKSNTLYRNNSLPANQQ